MSGRKAPNSRRNLDIAIQRLCGYGEAYVRARTAIANAVVGQMLPGGAVKGGSAIKLRFGDASTRYTTDLDVARATGLDDFIGDLESSLREGWGGFTGTVVPREPASPEGVPAPYVMQPFDIKLAYRTSAWCTVPLEVGHDEIGDADVPDWGMPDDVRDLFLSLGLPEPGPVPLMALDHQIAQKLHALTAPGSTRAHDLVDLQLIMACSNPDLSSVRSTCERLFAYRRAQAWPPEVIEGEGWDDAYARQSEGLDVLPTVSEAVSWANDLIGMIAGA